MKPPLITMAFSLVLLLAAPAGAKEKMHSLCSIHYPSDRSIPWVCRTLAEGDTPERIFGSLWRDGLRFNRMDRRHFVPGLSIKVPRRLEQISGFSPIPKFLPDGVGDAKLIRIDQNELFLGAYQNGRLIFSAPIAVGIAGYRLRNGRYRVDALDRWHASNLYPVEGTDRPYPMHWGLRFFVDKTKDTWNSYWIHGRDLPGYPVSHGCIGLYDEEMQKDYYGNPEHPLLKDAKLLYLWVQGARPDPQEFHKITDGTVVLLVGTPPR